MAYNQGKNPFSKNPLNFNSPLNSFDSFVGKLMNQGKSKEAATKIAGKVANAKMKGAGSGPTAAQKARAKGSPAKQAKPDFLDLDKDGNTSEPMKEAAKGSPANLKEKSPAELKSPAEKKLVGKQKNLPEGLKKAIEAAPESPAKMKSPVKAHDKALKALEKRIKRVRQSKEGSEGQGGIDYELLAQLEEQKKKLIESHGKETKQNAKPSPASMKSPMKKDGKKGDLLSKGVEAAGKAIKKVKADARSTINKKRHQVKQGVRKGVRAVKKFAKEQQKVAT